MVCTIAVVHAGGERYYLHLAREDYYTAGGEQPGRAYGRGAERVGLTSPIIEGDRRVRELFQGRHPGDGSVLRRGGQTERVYRDGDGRERVSKPVAAYDFTLSVEKSVSVLWATSDRATQQAISSVINRASDRVADYIDEHFAFTRVRTPDGKYQLEKVAPIFLAFEHSTSRELDPQKHVHLLLLNTGLREDGRGGALHAKAFLQPHSPHRAALTNLFHEEVRAGLERELGVRTYYTHLAQGRSVAVAGVPPSLAQHFSKRRKQIEAAVLPGDSSKQVQAKVLATRQKKLREVRHEELCSQWREFARAFGFDYREVIHREQARSQHHKERSSDEAAKNRGRARRHARSTFQHERGSTARGSREQHRSESEHAFWERRFSFEFLKAIYELHIQRKREAFARGVDKAFRKARQDSERRAKRYQRKQLFLYATGRITRAQYVRTTEGERGLLRTTFGINLAYAIRKISRQRQRYLLSKYGHTRKFERLPATRVGINVAYATYQINSHQRLALLYRHKLLRAKDVQTLRERAQALREEGQRMVDRVGESVRLLYDRAVARRQAARHAQQQRSAQSSATKRKEREQEHERR